MVVYLDLAFLLNGGADALALYATGRLAGLSIRWKRLLFAAVLGGTYGALCQLPEMETTAGILPQLAVSAGLVYLTFGRGEGFLRRFLLFFMVSCMLGGTMMVAGQILSQGFGLKVLQTLNWKVFFLVAILCYILLSVIFRGSVRHAVAGQLCTGWVQLGDKRAAITALLDTGHTLADTVSGKPVLIVESLSLRPLWTEGEWSVLRELSTAGAAFCLENLAELSPGRFRLMPYRAVGVSTGLLLCFSADHAALAGKSLGSVTVAISPTPVSDGGGYNSLWNSGQEEEWCHAA